MLGIDPLLPVADLVIGVQEAVLGIATAEGVDLVFARERMCGHGLNAGDASAPCYRGSGAAVWIDATCIHPGPAGHQILADEFLATITATPPLEIPASGRAVQVQLAGLLALALAALLARRARG